MWDREEKITEFNYEKFLPARVLEKLDTDSADFKDFVKVLNFNSKTQYEQHVAYQEEFKGIMPILRDLEEEEWKIFVHLVQNRNKTFNRAKAISNTLIDDACSNTLKEKLAKLSEEENYKLKNRFRHDRLTMRFADKSKMPVDSRKVRDILRHSNIAQHKIINEIDTYHESQNNTQFENGVLTYINEAAYGDLRALLKDIGINRESIQFTNVADMQR